MNDSTGTPFPGNRPANLVPSAANVPEVLRPYGPIGAHVDEPPGAPGELVLLLFEFWRVLRRRKWLIASVAIAFMAFGALGTLMTTPLYTATVRLQIDRNVAKFVESGGVVPVEGSDA